MWVIVHTLTGLALGTLLESRQLWVLVLGALALHLVLDLIPHWDYTRETRAWLWSLGDLTASVVVLVVARTVLDADWKVIATAVVSAAPDIDPFLSLVFPDRRVRFFPSHWNGFPHGACDRVPGIATQAVVCAAAIAIVLA